MQPDAIWVDRYQIEVADKFTPVIAAQIQNSQFFLAILSNGYVSSGWCTAELDCFARRWPISGEHLKTRIFRIDKHGVREDELPEPLRHLQAIQLFQKDPETGLDEEFFDRGRIVRTRPYQQAIKKLAVSIRQRLKELDLLPSHSPGPENGLGTERGSTPPFAGQNGVTIYVARPAFDMEEAYQTLVSDLVGHGHVVVPSGELPTEGEQTLEVIRSSLAQAEFSIHLVGNRKGFQPAELSTPTVALQLAEAAQEAARRPGFQRVIWAPRIMPYRNDPEVRDPLRVLAQLDPALATDEIVGDTLARFNDFVFQRIKARRAAEQPAVTLAVAKPPSVYITAIAQDGALAIGLARQLKASGLRPQVLPKDTAYALASRFEHVAFCWGDAAEVDVLDALDRLEESDWRRLHPNGKLLLLTFSPDEDSQALACELDSFGSATSVLPGAPIEAVAEAIAGTA